MTAFVSREQALSALDALCITQSAMNDPDVTGSGLGGGNNPDKHPKGWYITVLFEAGTVSDRIPDSIQGVPIQKRVLGPARLLNSASNAARVAAADTAENTALAAAERTRTKVDEFIHRGWPTSAEVGRRLNKSTTNPEQYAAAARTRGQLLGAWDAKRRTFVHPSFQFDELGRIDPRVERLMAAFAKHPDLCSESDKGGWRRVFWLYSIRREFGDGSEISEDRGNEAPEGHPLVRGVTPAEKFAANADSIIRLVQSDVERLRLNDKSGDA